MNGTKVATIICWAISALVLTGLIIWFIISFVIGGNGLFGGIINIPGINFGSTENLSGAFVSQGTQEANTTSIDSINISWVAGEVTLTPHDGNAIEVTEYAQRNLRDNERLQMNTEGSTLTIRFRERVNIGNMPRKNLEVLVPRELSENLEALTISTTSGNVKVDSFEAQTTKLNSVSANINISNIVSQLIDISTTSGDIGASSVRTGKLDTSTVSGDLTATETIATILDINSTSGRTNATGEFDRIDASSVSGDKTIRSSAVPSQVRISTTSGDTNLYIPNQGEITVNHSAVSGRFSSEVSVRIQNSAAYNFSSVSGDTNIYVMD